MAAPVVSSRQLLDALAQARARGPINDYYGLGSALNGFSTAYGNLGKDLRGATDALNQNDAYNANQAAGYYPAHSAMAVAKANKNRITAEQQAAEIQDVQHAVDTARMKGLTPGTNEFQLEVTRNLHTAHAIGQYGPGAKEAQQNLQRQQAAKAAIEQGMQRITLMKTAEQNYAKAKAQYEAGGTALLPGSYEDKQFKQQAVEQAKQHMQEVQFHADFDPSTGQATMRDGNGAEVQIDSKLLAVAFKMAGLNQPFDALNSLTNTEQKGDSLAVKNAQAAIKQAGAAAPKAGAGGKAAPDLTAQGISDEHKHIRALEMQLAKLDPAASPKQIETIQGLIQNHNARLAALNGSVKNAQGQTLTGVTDKDLLDMGIDPVRYHNTVAPGQYEPKGEPGMDYASPPMSYSPLVPDGYDFGGNVNERNTADEDID